MSTGTPMTPSFAIAPAPIVVLPVAGSAQVFPVQRVFCIGRNYRWSADETPSPVMPPWFMKPASAIVPAHGSLPYPPGTDEYCYEIELVVALGRGGRDIAPEAVESEHIWGYAAGLDMTRRDLQQAARRNGGPWEPGKVFDAAAPCTSVVPHAICGHPRKGALWLKVNGSDRQRGDLADLLWPVCELVAMLSRSLTLLPGDLIYTGTPAGVGPLHLGDHIEASIDGIGHIRMTVEPH